MDIAPRDDKYLNAKISRHLLFNSLNSAVALCRRSPEDAAEFLQCLSQCLLYTSQQPQGTLVPLKEELSFVKSYLHIQSVRFGKRLHIKFNLEESRGLLPSYTLQSLVDNVFSHVMLRTRESVALSIETYKDKKGIILKVKDNRVGMEKEQLENFWQKYQGRSLDEINVSLLKCGMPGLVIESQKNKGTCVSVPVKF